MANLMKRNENRDVQRGLPRTDWDPYRMMESLLRWDPFRSDTAWGFGTAGYSPSFDLKETRDAYVVKADLPGVQDKDLEITVTGNALSISGQREEEHREQDDQVYMIERNHGRFTRVVSLPEGADVDNVKAELKDGVLTLQVPKRPEVQPRRISLGKAQSDSSAKA
jgi:HSP20 family protein